MEKQEDTYASSTFMFYFIVFNTIFTLVIYLLFKYIHSGKVDRVGKKVLKRNRLTDSALFKKFCKSAFEQVDIDNSNTLDKTEVYCAVLLLYTKLIAYSSYSVPPPREFVLNLVDELDTDKSGSLSLKEFEVLSAILFHHIANRITTEILFTFVIGPYIASQAIMMIDSVIEAPSWLPIVVVETLGPFRDSLFVTLIISLVVPQLLKLYERLTKTEADSVTSSLN